MNSGSSPLTRGKPSGVAHLQDDNGLIPAHAGKTEIARAEDVNAKAHPRSRGENKYLAHDLARQGGSSPLTRGKLIQGYLVGIVKRLIPAHAGKTA